MGIIIMLKAKPPAQAEKWWIGTTMMVQAKIPMTMEGHAVQQVCGVADHHGESRFSAEFRQINPAQESYRNADDGRDQDQHAASDDGIRHASARLRPRTMEAW